MDLSGNYNNKVLAVINKISGKTNTKYMDRSRGNKNTVLAEIINMPGIN